MRAQAVPARQLRQMLAFDVLQVPGGQGSGVIMPILGHLEPAAHGVHDTEPEKEE